MEEEKVVNEEVKEEVLDEIVEEKKSKKEEKKEKKDKFKKELDAKDAEIESLKEQLETFKDKLDESSVLRIVIDTLEHYRDGATEEDMVKLLSYIPDDRVVNVCYLSDKYNLSLEKILTLL